MLIFLKEERLVQGPDFSQVLNGKRRVVCNLTELLMTTLILLFERLLDRRNAPLDSAVLDVSVRQECYIENRHGTRGLELSSSQSYLGQQHLDLLVISCC